MLEKQHETIKRLLTADELAQYIGSTPKTVYTLKCKGKIQNQGDFFLQKTDKTNRPLRGTASRSVCLPRFDCFALRSCC